MKELDLYQFLKENEVEMRWDSDVLSTWIPHCDLYEFCKLVESSLEEGGIPAQLQAYGTIWIDLVPICSRYDIDPERIFKKP